MKAMRPNLKALLITVCAILCPLVAQAATTPSITISPGYTNLAVGATLQYSATVTGLTNTAVTWTVNEIVGGNSTIGTISSTGLYKAPATVPTASTLIVAIGSDGKTLGLMYVNIEAAGPPITAITPNPIHTGNYSITVSGTGFVSEAVVSAGGIPLATKFVNATTLTATGSQGSASPVVFQVANPGTLPGASLTVPFTSVAAQTISPTTANVTLGATQQFTSNGATSFTATAGTITSSGLYTAPATMPASKTVTITATGPGGTANATVTLVAPASQAISPTTASIQLGATKQFTSSGATSFTATAGTITSSGLYTAPAAMPAAGGTVTVTATGPGGTASATVTLTTPPQTISPTTASVILGASQQFTTNTTGATWTASVGNITSSGLYTAPASTSATSATVTVTGTDGSANATVTLIAPQSISPTTTSILPGATQQFISTGATSFTLTGAGVITNTGLYTAPATLPSSPNVTVTATGPGGSASASITILSPQQISPTSAPVNLGATQQFTTNTTGATWTALFGTVDQTGFYTAPASLSSTGTDTVTVTGTTGATASAMITLVPPTPTITSAGTGGQIPLGVFNVTVTGSGFISGSVVSLNGTALSTTFGSSTSLTVAGFVGQGGSGNLTVSNGSVTSPLFSAQIGVQNPLVTPAAARRFLEQAAFGPTPTDAETVQTLGFQGWLTAQFQMPQVSNYDTVTLLTPGEEGGLSTHFVSNAVTNPDQLRQKVAFALSQIFTTSVNTLIWDSAVVPYQDLLLKDAFVNYRQLMNDVTLSAAMGQYLNMANNAMGDPTTGAQANQNYARELMQLFTLGTNLLNPDGTVQLDGHGLPLPTYIQSNISEFARVYTGWTYAPDPGNPVTWNAGPTFNGLPMVSIASEHDSGSKQLLLGAVSPAGVSPQQDLNNALDNIFNHPNIGPFVATQLIQHLVKSNPSPTYVSRVAAAFNSNSNGVRGDMVATITAILLDPEARANDQGGNDQSTDGHLQEPALFLPGMIRAFGGQMNDQNYYSGDLQAMNEDIFNPASVFSYYQENFMVPGTSQQGGEFEIYSPNTALIRANEVSNLFSQFSSPVQTFGPGTTVDLTPFVALAANPATLVNALDLTLTHGVMPATMKSNIATAVSNDSVNGPLNQVQMACYLILTSSYYNVWH